MQHAGGAGGRAGVPERRAAGEGEAVGGLERSPGGREKPSGETHQGPAAAAGQREAEQVKGRARRTQTNSLHLVPVVTLR